MLALVRENARSEGKLLIDFEGTFQRKVIAIVLYSLHNSLLVIVSCRCIVTGSVAASRDGSIVFLIENVAEENVVPVSINRAQVVNLLLCRSRERIPTACTVGVELVKLV